MKMIGLVLMLTICGAAQAPPNSVREAKLIADAKAVSVHKLDLMLPDLSFEKWFQKESGPDARYHWEVNDCGEQTGSPNDTGPIPTCVEADSTLKDGREIIIFLGDDSPPKSKAPDWKIFFVDLVTPHERINLRRLSDLPAALIKTRQPTNLPETAK